MNLKNFKITNKGLYWGLILTFAILYLCVGFVSTLHSITFFHLANTLGLAVLLGLTYEVGQASVLFSILMTDKEHQKILPWALMVLLTGLQVTANVYASFKFMATSGSNDWVYWQKSILFGVQAANPEMYQVIISWIAGALLPIVALGMTALVAQNMNLITEENTKPEEIIKTTITEENVTDLSNLPDETKEKFEKEIEKNIPEVKEEKPSDVPEVKSVQEILDEANGITPGIWNEDSALKNGLPTLEEQHEGFKNAILNNIQKKASPMEENPVIGEGGVQIVRPQIEMNVGPTEEEATAEFEKSLAKEGITMGEGGVQMIKPQFEKDLQGKEEHLKYTEKDLKEMSNSMDEDIKNYIPDSVNIGNLLNASEIIDSAKNIKDDNVITTIIKTEVVKDENPEIPSKTILKIQPVNKVQGWHFMKEFVDKDHNIFQRGVFVKNDPEKTPTESKKA